MSRAAYYITTPIYYVNDSPHIGHAYTTLACDVIARFLRLDGRDVKFLTGTDEHGQKVEKAAAAAGEAPQAFTDRVSGNFRDLADRMHFSYDDFIRTTEKRHAQACGAIWNRIRDAGDIYLGTYSGWYSVRDEAFWGEDELAKAPDGKYRAPSGAEVEWVEEPSFFFRLSAWGDRLLRFYEDNPTFIQPDSRRNEVVSFVRGGLRDLSVSRTSFRWGVPVPGEPDHIMYVWLDALTNYITAAEYPDEESDSFNRYWPADVHMVGKDILRFHAVYWPAFLMSAGLAPPRRVFAHGWWTHEGEKISKSVGNVIDPLQLIEQYGVDPVRYFMLREVPFGNDGDFSHSAMVGRMNGDLANDLGNLCQRVLSMIQAGGGGVVPPPSDRTAADLGLLAAAEDALPRARAAVHDQRLHAALAEIWGVIGDANRYVDSQAPWSLRKTDPGRADTVLYVLAEAIRRIGLMVSAFLPASGARILDQLAVAPENRTFAAFGSAHALAPGTQLPKPAAVFPRMSDERGPQQDA